MVNLFNKKKHGEKMLKCPRCKIYMEKIKKQDVIIDICNKCNGMWLDDEEIDKLIKLGGKDERKKKSK